MGKRKNAVAREVRIGEEFVLRDDVEIVFESKVRAHGNSARVGVPKEYIGKRAYVVIVKD